MEKKKCKCDIESAVYNDLGEIKCSYCGRIVDKKRADTFKKYNEIIN